jgi:FKBP12-rapamycin complex-associated protein
LPWLNSRIEPSDYRRYAAVLVCRELASEAPAVFNVHVKAFLDGIWGGLRDPKLHVREASVQALEVRRPAVITCHMTGTHYELV